MRSRKFFVLGGLTDFLRCDGDGRFDGFLFTLVRLGT